MKAAKSVSFIPAPLPGAGALSRRRLLQASACIAAASVGVQSAWAQSKTLKIGTRGAGDSEAVGYVVKQLLEEQFQYKVELVTLTMSEMFNGVADGKIDLMMSAWLPNAHKALLAPVAGKVEELGVLYQGTRIGWVVPDYVPREQVDSVADLAKPEIKARIGGKIFGVEPNAGTMRASRKAIEEYGLTGWDLQEGNGVSLEKSVDDAIKNRAWYVSVGWTPHYMFSKHRLRYLKDPKGVFGSLDDVYALGRMGFSKDHPQVTQLIKQIRIPVRDVETLMFIARMGVYKGDTHEATQQRTAAAWIKTQDKQVKSWLKGLR